jgi:hypothetical protein
VTTTASLKYAARNAALCGSARAKVGQPVVDQVDDLPAAAQAFAVEGQFRHVGHQRSDAIRLEELPEECKFGRQILFIELRIDNRDARQRPL